MPCFPRGAWSTHALTVSPQPHAHSFILQQMCAECLLGARGCRGHWGTAVGVTPGPALQLPLTQASEDAVILRKLPDAPGSLQG